MSNCSSEDEENTLFYQVNELIQYCADGKLDIIPLYINPKTVNCVDNEGRTPLYAAACSGNVELCSFLLSSNADANQQTGHDFYPIHGASSHGHDNVLNLLLKHTTGINVQDSNGDTALHLACCRGNEECVNILLDAGSALDIKNNLDKTPAMEAASNSHFNIMQVLKDFGNSKVPAKKSIAPSPISNLPPHISLPIFSPVENENQNIQKLLEDSRTPESGPTIGSLPELLSPSIIDVRFLRQNNRPSSEQSYYTPSSSYSNSVCSNKFSEIPLPKKSLSGNYLRAGTFTNSVSDDRHPLETNSLSDCVIKHMLESFLPSPESLLTFRLSMVKELVQRQASQNNIAKEFFVMLHTLKKDASPSTLLIIDNIFRDFRIDSIFDFYTNYNVGNGMRVNIDFAIDTSKDCLFIRDPSSSRVELISLDTTGLGNFNIKIALLNPEQGQFYDPATERVNNEKLLRYLSKYDPAYQILYHTYILQPSHIYCASIEDYLPYLNYKDKLSFPLPATVFFILTPIIETSLYQFLHQEPKDQDFSDSSQDLIILSLLSDCLLALEHLKQLGVVHRNITAQNILVDIKLQRALLSNFSTCIDLFNINEEPYLLKDINNKIPLFGGVSEAPELIHFSSLPQDQLSDLELSLVYRHVDTYSIGRSFYHNIFNRDARYSPSQEYYEDDIITPHNSGTTREFLQKILLNLISNSPQARMEPLPAARSIICLLSLEEYLLREPTDLLLTSLLAAHLTDNRSLSLASLYFYILCGKEEVNQAQEYYFKK
ncbi:Ankyrin repeat containing protein [Oopsacas minuta]|uniref:Ankyrin repeat containing protein n=1 Tax=Oopsacas minuta TaxID=111878 RepID=A0AAV7JML9_9METZ|nr:Ankyrin repeat containing protein [Oopsacas minuta]